MGENILSMKNVIVNRKNRKNVLNIENFSMKAGEIIAVVGPNGAGKSTFLQANNLLIHFDGEIKLFGENIENSNKTKIRRRCSYVFQEMLLLKDTVFNNVAKSLQFRGFSKSEISEKVNKVLKDFECEHLANRSAHKLSGGEAQRVCIARAMVTEPEILLLDEPSASLDAQMRSEMIRHIKEVAEERGIAVILVSHNFSDVLYFAQRVIVMFDGRIIQDDKPETLMHKPINKDVAKLVGMDNIISCNIKCGDKKSFVRLNNDISFIYPKEISENVDTLCISGDCINIYDESFFYENKEWVIFKGTIDMIIPDIGSYKIKINLENQTLIARVLRNNIGNKIYKSSLIKLAFKLDDVNFI